MKKIFLLILMTTLAEQGQAASLFDECNGFFSKLFNSKKTETKSATVDRSYVLDQHKNNTFTTGRSLGQYMVAFNRPGYAKLSLKSDLEKIKMDPNAHWLDAGGGAGFATEELALSGAQMKSTLVSVETPAVDLVDETSKAVKRKVISGKFIEDIADKDIPKSDIITDLYGPMAYTSQPNKVLRKYVDNLKENGVAYIYMGEELDMFGQLNKVATKDGKILSLSEWIESIPGLKAEVVKVDGLIPDTSYIRGERSRVLKITLENKASEISIPDLERLSFQEGGSNLGYVVPRTIFKEVGAVAEENAAVVLNNSTVDNSLKKVFTNFRSGEFEHVLLDKVETLNGGSWAHFANEEINFQQAKNLSIKEKEYFEMGTNRILSRFKSLAEKNISPQVTTGTQLKGQKELSLISDHNGHFLSEGPVDQTLKKYLDSLADDGTMILNLGNESTGLSASRVVSSTGEVKKLKEWLSDIPGLSVVYKRTKETQDVVRKKLVAANSSINLQPNTQIEEFVDQEVQYGTVAVIKIKDRKLIDISKLKLLGKSAKNSEGFEVPMFQAE